MERSKAGDGKAVGAGGRAAPAVHGEAESTYAWVRLGAALLLSTIGGVLGTST